MISKNSFTNNFAVLIIMGIVFSSCDFFNPLVNFNDAKKYFKENTGEFNQIAESLNNQNGFVIVTRGLQNWALSKNDITYFFSGQSYGGHTLSIRINLDGVDKQSELEIWNSNLKTIKDANIDLSFRDFIDSCMIDSTLVLEVIRFLITHPEIKIISKPPTSDYIRFGFKGDRGLDYFSIPKEIESRNEKGWRVTNKWYYFQN